PGLRAGRRLQAQRRHDGAGDPRVAAPARRRAHLAAGRAEPQQAAGAREKRNPDPAAAAQEPRRARARAEDRAGGLTPAVIARASAFALRATADKSGQSRTMDS